MPAAVAEKIALYRSEVEARGRRFDPMQVAVARNIYVATSARDAAAALERQAEQHARMLALSQRPDGTNRSHITAYADAPGSTSASSIYGSPEKVVLELRALEQIGVRYVLLGGGQSRDSMRRFAAHIMPAISGD
jgi:alkanesulfonate monooxygenase SsuD/methylene tetrahydromethanopterin reductase-like flavin-dependent oxidoreductase (luciferase family)